MDGWIKLHRSLLKWRWYKDANTLRLFIHILLNVSRNDYEYGEIKVKAGQLITGRKKLAKELGLSEQEIRTALAHLQKTQEIALQSTKQYSIITLNNWKCYQEINQPSTNHQPHNKKDKKSNLLHKLLRSDFEIKKEFIPLIEMWLKYKSDKQQSYKNDDSLKAFIKKLLKLSGSNFLKAEKIIEQSLSNNWAGIFDLKESSVQNSSVSGGVNMNSSCAYSKEKEKESRRLAAIDPISQADLAKNKEKLRQKIYGGKSVRTD